MKQGTAIDLLGQDDPRAKDIGIIYVSPTDDRRSVLAAILTQEKLDRKQIAVVLPTQNKAFQRPADFDDLKNVRRKLQAQIVFIAPGGPGPAEFARQRRFPVYSSLEYYARALRDESAAAGATATPTVAPVGGRKRGGLFGGGRSAAGAPAPSPTGKNAPPATPAPLPISMPPIPARSPTPATSQASPPPATPPGVQPAADVTNIPTVPIASTSTPFDEDDAWAISPSTPVRPPATPANPVVSSGTASTFGPQGGMDRTSANPPGAGPEPLILGQGSRKPRRTVELNKGNAPVPLVAPASTPLLDPDEEVAPKRPTGKTGPIIAATAIGAGTAMAADATIGGAKGAEAPPWQATNTAPASMAGSPPVVPAPTPMRTVPPPVPPRQGGRTTTTRDNRRRRGGLALFLAILLICSVLLCGGIALAAPSLGIHIFGNSAAAPAFTISITPNVQQITNNYAISAVTGTPDPNSLQVQARTLTGDAQSASQTVNATGQKQTAATFAHGLLTFYNSNTVSMTIARTVITASNNIQVENDASVTIPAGSPASPSFKSVAATAVQPGANGNITTGLVAKGCCASGVAVQNNSAFTGGVDPQNYTIVQQSDITGVSNSVTPGLITKAQVALGAKLGKSEHYAENGTCTPTVGSDHNAGDKASTVTVQVSMHCVREVYDTSQIAAVVTGQMTKTVQNATGTHFGSYVLLDGQGNKTALATVLGTTQSGFDPQKGTVSLQVHASGTWVYQFSAAEQQNIKKLIAGKTVAQAITILQSQPGVDKASIQPNTGTLPTDMGQIGITPVPERGVTGSGGTGSGGGGAEGTPVTTSPTMGPLPTGTGVGMG